MADTTCSCDGVVDFVQGDIVDVVIYLKDECDADAPVNLGGCTVFQIGFKASPSNIILTLGAGVTILDPSAGSVRFVLSAAQSAQITASTYNAKTQVYSTQDIELHYEIGSAIARTLTLTGVMTVRAKRILP